MPRDASLTDFASPDGSDDQPSDGADDDPTRDGATDAARESGASTAGGDAGADGERGRPTPARSTYEWTPDGAVCAACGGRTTRRWRLGDDLVCPDCKTW